MSQFSGHSKTTAWAVVKQHHTDLIALKIGKGSLSHWKHCYINREIHLKDMLSQRCSYRKIRRDWRVTTVKLPTTVVTLMMTISKFTWGHLPVYMINSCTLCFLPTFKAYPSQQSHMGPIWARSGQLVIWVIYGTHMLFPKIHMGPIWAISGHVLLWDPHVRPDNTYGINMGSTWAGNYMGPIWDPHVDPNSTYGLNVGSI